MAWRWPIAPVVLLAGCLGTPQPDPPNLDPDLLATGGERGEDVMVIGGPGAVSPGGASLHLANLETADPVVVVAVGEDGAFSALLSATYADELRLWAVAGGDRSEPVDVVLTEPIGLAPRPLAACFRSEPALAAVVAEGRELTVVLVNECDETVSVSRASLREPDAPFTVGPAPASIEPGGRADLAVSFAPPSADPAEAILLVEVDAPEHDRRPVTLFGSPAEP